VWLKQIGRCSDLYGIVQPVDRSSIPGGKEDFSLPQNIYAGSGFHSSSNWMKKEGSLPEANAAGACS
jgi:hypothetical protein